ncbi:MAG: hypothetical protein ACXWC6_04610 [Ramlibacter sp.]
MRILSVSLSLLALAVCAGCAEQPRTTQMGAGPASTVKLYCRDGAWVTVAGGCAMHGGVERDMSSPTQK